MKINKSILFLVSLLTSAQCLAWEKHLTSDDFANMLNQGFKAPCAITTDGAHLPGQDGITWNYCASAIVNRYTGVGFFIHKFECSYSKEEATILLNELMDQGVCHLDSDVRAYNEALLKKIHP